jgi:hypothetical protein
MWPLKKTPLQRKAKKMWETSQGVLKAQKGPLKLATTSGRT